MTWPSGASVDAVSHSPYWDDTAFFILEDDLRMARTMLTHTAASRWSSVNSLPLAATAGGTAAPVVDHSFYTTINMVRTIESLLGVPP